MWREARADTYQDEMVCACAMASIAGNVGKIIVAVSKCIVTAGIIIDIDSSQIRQQPSSADDAETVCRHRLGVEGQRHTSAMPPASSAYRVAASRASIKAARAADCQKYAALAHAAIMPASLAGGGTLTTSSLFHLILLPKSSQHRLVFRVVAIRARPRRRRTHRLKSA